MSYDARHDTLNIAVTGIGGVFPGAADVDAFWDLIASADHRSVEIPGNRWPVPPQRMVHPGEAVKDRARSTRACLIESLAFDPGAFGLDPNLLMQLDPVFHLMLMGGHAAFNDQKGRPARLENTGVILGNIVLPTETVSAMTRELAEPALRELVTGTLSYDGANPPDAANSNGGANPVGGPARTGGNQHPVVHPLNRYPSALPAGLLARSLGLGGGSFTLDAACASSLYAVKLAVNALNTRRLDAVITGGVGRPDSMYTQMGFSQLRALSPSGICAPFDGNADGLVVGEGAAMMVLKRLEDAVRDGDRIYCVIRGIGLSNDVGGSLFAPDSEGQLRAMRKAYDQAGWLPGDVDLVECHATGTPVGDAVEFHSMKTLWAETGARPPKRCVIGSVKSNIGHLLTGAGGAGMIKTILAMRHGTLPPTANFETPAASVDLENSPFRVLRTPEPWSARTAGKPRKAAVSAFGFGGINAHVLVEEYLSGGDLPESFLPERTVSETVPSVTIGNTEADAAGGTDEPAPVAVVGMAVSAGPWVTMKQAQTRMLGWNETSHPPDGKTSDAQWRFLTRSRWFCEHAVDPHGRRNHMGSMNIPPGRFRIPPAELREMLPQQLIMLKTAADAVENSAWRNDLAPESGVFIGIGLDLDTTRFQVRWHLEHAAPAWLKNKPVPGDWTVSVMDAWSPPLTANRTMGALGGIVASRIARALKAGGAGFTVSAHETSGFRAVETAVSLLRSGDIRQALAGAVDIATDWRALYGEQWVWRTDDPDIIAPVTDGAVALVLKPLADAEADGDTVLAVIRDINAVSGTENDLLPHAQALETACRRVWKSGESAGREPETEPGIHGFSGRGTHRENDLETSVYQALWEDLPDVRKPFSMNVTRSVGHTGAAAGLVSIAAAVAGLHHRVIPGALNRGPEYWLRNREDGARSALICGMSIDGNAAAIALSEHEGSSGHALRLPCLDEPFEERFSAALELSMGSAGRVEKRSPLAFVYPGSGTHQPFQGRDMALAFRHVMDTLDRESLRLREQFQPQLYWNQPDRTVMDQDLSGLIVGHVAYGFLVSELLGLCGVRPDAVLGYSLGESTALVAQRIWPDRDAVLMKLQKSTLFTEALGGPCTALLAEWELPPGVFPEWKVYTVSLSAERVRELMEGYPRIYLLIKNTPDQCVIGGHAPDIIRFVHEYNLQAVEVTGVTVAHVPAVHEVAGDYTALHYWPVNNPRNMSVYSGAWSTAYPVKSETCADAILAHATEGIDFIATVEEAYSDGIRTFLEIGPGNGCSRMIEQILKGRDHRRLALDAPAGQPLNGTDTAAGRVSALFELLLEMHRHGWPVDPSILLDRRKSLWMEPDMPVTGGIACQPVHDRPPLPGPGVTASMPAAVRGTPADSAAPVPSLIGLPQFTDRDVTFRNVPPATRLAQQMDRTSTAVSRAQAQYMELSRAWSDSMQRLIEFQMHTANAMRETESMGVADPRRSSYPLTGSPPPEAVFMDRDRCLEFARGSVAAVLGPDFAEADDFPTRVRLPDEPLMLVDRIIRVEGTPKSMTRGRVITEHDVHPGAWYLDQGKCPVCIAVEAGQADLFLSGYLGIDFETRGIQKYRLLDADITMHRGLPEPGETIRYDIRITRFFRQGGIWLFHFEYDATINEAPMLTMRNGCAGFFSDRDLEEGRGIVKARLDAKLSEGETRGVTAAADSADTGVLSEQVPGILPDHIFVPSGPSTCSEAQLEALRQGDLAGCFGEEFNNLSLKNPPRLPGGRMHLIDRVTVLDPAGGDAGLGFVRAEADIDPRAWFLTCHFVDDMVMPGTLMYECCFHAFRVLLMRIGWIGDADDFVWDPRPGEISRLKCRGQVIRTTATAAYEITVREIGFDPVPYAVADALMYADGRPVVEIHGMSVQLTGLTRDGIAALWQNTEAAAAVPGDRPALYDKQSILAFSNGKPSEAFGAPYAMFDGDAGRVIARLPGPPYQFLDRVVQITSEPWRMESGGRVTAEYDVPETEWYLDANGRSGMPYAVLLEIALQPCGWFSAFMGSALHSDVDLSYRNLGGEGTVHRIPSPGAGPLAITVDCINVSKSGGMILQHFDFRVYDAEGDIYSGSTYFGFFTKAALADQVGIRDESLYDGSGTDTARRIGPFPDDPRLPVSPLRMMDTIPILDPSGGPEGLGFIKGTKRIDPEEWFFKAHFYQDPVWPGSLGLEAMLQLMQVLALDRWGDAVSRFELTGTPHTWNYRGQVVPSNAQVTVQALVTAVNDAARTLRARGYLAVDGRLIYSMSDFELRAF